MNQEFLHICQVFPSVVQILQIKELRTGEVSQLTQACVPSTGQNLMGFVICHHDTAVIRTTLKMRKWRARGWNGSPLIFLKLNTFISCGLSLEGIDPHIFFVTFCLV